MIFWASSNKKSLEFHILQKQKIDRKEKLFKQ